MIWLSTEIDNLSIKITSTSASAVREIDKLTKSLERLQKNSGLDAIAKSFDKIGKAVDKGLDASIKKGDLTFNVGKGKEKGEE